MAKKKKDLPNNAETHCEETASPDETRGQGEEIADDQNAEIQTLIAELSKKCDDYLQMAQRAQADFDNYKRRNEAAKNQAYSDGITDALSAILPVMDNFDRAVAAIPADDSSKAILDGVLMVKKQLETALGNKGVHEIPSEKGDVFDPALYNAVMTAPLEEGFESGTIAVTFQKGYKLNEKVIRYATVSVFSE